MTTPTRLRALNRRPAATALGLLLLSIASVPAMSSAQEADALFRDFEPYGDVHATLNGEHLKGSRVFVANRAGSYLVLAEQMDEALLINARTKQVNGIAKDKVRTNESGTMDVLADASFNPIGPFEIQGQEVSVPLPSGELRLVSTPSLLGLQSGQGLIEHNSSYGFKAAQYPTSADKIATLKKEQRDVQVRVYFGSWCSTCSRMVPWILRVEQELEGSNIDFEYYGLPREMNDPKAEAMDVHGVPTMLVFLDGKEIGRRGADGLGVPEGALIEILGSAP